MFDTFKTQNVIDALQVNASKVAFIQDNHLVEAIRQIETGGFPNNKNEEYKYCNIEFIIRKHFQKPLQQFETINALEIEKYKIANAINIIVINGVYQEAYSDVKNEPKIQASTLDTIQSKSIINSIIETQNDFLVALNNLFCTTGLYLEVEENSTISKPIYIISLVNTKGAAILNYRNVINVKSHAKVSIIEQFHVISDDVCFLNYTSEKNISESSNFEGYTLQNDKWNFYTVNTQAVNVAKNCNYNYFTFSAKAALIRNNHTVNLCGQNSKIDLNGLFIAQNGQLIDNHTKIAHLEPHCESSELYKGILKDKSVGVFNGKIYVKKDAQKTNAYQSSKNILLDDTAEINVKPQLEIYADDVKCSHGTSTGKLDESALYYLKARGIGETEAKKMLLHAFTNNALNAIKNSNIQQQISNSLLEFI